MVRALFYLRFTSLLNMLRVRAGRLRQPQYLFAAVVTAAYFYYFFFRRMGMPFSGGRRDAMPMAVVLFSALFMAVLLLARPVLTWLGPAGKAGLGFTEAEIAFLFPAPFTRRRLIHYYLLNSQIGTFVSALFFSLISSRWIFLGGGALTRVLGWWVIFATLNLHQTAAALTIARLEERGVPAIRRRAVVVGLIVLFIAAVIFSLWRDGRLPRSSDFSSGPEFQNYIATVLDSGWMPWLLWPIKLVARPFLAHSGPTFLLGLEPALLVLAAHYLWALRLEAGFEEGSMAIAQKRSLARAARQAGGSPWAAAPSQAGVEPFRLAGSGRPEIAFLWKNLLMIRVSVNWRLVLIPLVIVTTVAIPFSVGSSHGPKGPLIAAGAGILAFYMLLVGPQYARQDLRSDLANADMLKTYPLAGWQVVFAEMLAPAAILCGVLWFCILAGALAIRPGFPGWLTPGVRATVALCLAATVPAVCLLQLLVPNTAMLLFPAWHHATRSRGGGVEVVGQRLIFFFGQLLLLLLALLPAVVAAVLLIFASCWVLGLVPAILLGTAGVLAILVAELWVGLWWMGGRFEKFDLSTELKA